MAGEEEVGKKHRACDAHKNLITENLRALRYVSYVQLAEMKIHEIMYYISDTVVHFHKAGRFKCRVILRIRYFRFIPTITICILSWHGRNVCREHAMKESPRPPPNGNCAGRNHQHKYVKAT